MNLFKHCFPVRLFFSVASVTLVCLCHGSPIPANRLPSAGNWQGAGISGGIPDTSSWTVINVKTQFGAKGDGTTDDTQAIQNALNAAQAANAPRVVYIPTGTYRLNGQLLLTGIYNYDFVQHRYTVVIKGDGPTLTKLQSYSTSGNIIGIVDAAGLVGGSTITSGNSAGSNSIVVAGTQYLDVGDLCIITHNNTSAGISPPSYMIDTMSQIVKITSKTGTGPTSISFTPALNQGFSDDKFQYVLSPPYRCGIESLSVKRMVNGGSHNIYFAGAQECWIRNIESEMATGWHIRFAYSGYCEVRNSYIHDGWNGGGDTDYGVGLFRHCCNNLVENNIFYHTRHSMITEYGGQNNVFAYNYSKDTINENQLNTDWIMGDMISHGGWGTYNLWEGNVAQRLSFDDELGGSGYLLAFRNQVQRIGVLGLYPANQNPLRAVEVMRDNLNINIVGNILLTAGQTVDSYDNGGIHGSVRRLGYHTDGDGNTAGIDANVAATLLYHMNWDYVYGSSDASYTSALAVDNNLPNSYYLTGIPSWWDKDTNGAYLPWPAIGPDLKTEKAGANPAFRRWQAYAAGGSTNKTLLFPAILTSTPSVTAPSNATITIKQGL